MPAKSVVTTFLCNNVPSVSLYVATTVPLYTSVSISSSVVILLPSKSIVDVALLITVFESIPINTSFKLNTSLTL